MTRRLAIWTVVAVVLGAPAAAAGRERLLALVALAWLAVLTRLVLAALRASQAAPAGVSPPRRADRLPAQLTRLERTIVTGTADAADYHVGLRRQLRPIAASRLRRHDVVLDADAAEARALLGDEGYALVRPDRRPPAERLAAGPPQAVVGRLLDRLESL